MVLYSSGKRKLKFVSADDVTADWVLNKALMLPG
jgi:hypothetical protein